MTEAIKISTSKYNKEGKVDIDGHVWSVKLPGAGTEMRFSQASRACNSYEARLKIIDKKIEDGTVTEADLDRYDEFLEKYAENEKIVFDIFLEGFRDGTPDNSEVTKWIQETPTAVIMLAFEDIKQTANAKGTDGQAKEEDSQSS